MTRAPSRSLFVMLLLFVAASANAACPYSRLISFGGYDWCVKGSRENKLIKFSFVAEGVCNSSRHES